MLRAIKTEPKAIFVQKPASIRPAGVLHMHPDTSARAPRTAARAEVDAKSSALIAAETPPGAGAGNITVMMNWTPDLCTGVPKLDEQHKEIFEWLAELQSATADERTLFGVYVITRLKHYMREHFATEEALMKAAGYPGLVQHMAKHAEFRAKLEELQLKSIAEDISEDTVSFLTEWLTHHIVETDMAYVPYLDQLATGAEN